MRANQITLPLYTPVAIESPSLLRRGQRLFMLLSLAALYGVSIAFLPLQLIMVPVFPIVVLLLLSLWMLPDRTSFPERALMTSFNWFITLYYLWPSYIAIALPGLPWFSAGRLGLVALLVIATYCLSTSSTFRRQVLQTAQSSRVIWTLMLVGLATQVLSLPLSPSPIVAITKYLNNQAYWTLPFFVGCFIFLQSGRITKFLGLMTFIVLTLSIVGFFEHTQQKLFWEGHIPNFLKVDDAQVMNAVFSGQMRDYIGTYRVHTTFTVSLIYAELLVLILPFVLHWMIVARTTKLRLAMIASWIMISSNILFTDTRLGKIGFIVAHVGYALMWSIRSRRRRANFATAAAVVAIPFMSVMMVGLIFASHRLHAMIFGSEGYAGSTDARVEQMTLGIPKILHNPFGYGAGMGGPVLGYHIPGGLLTIDSQFLKTALESGVVGMLATYGLFIWAAFKAIRIFFAAQDPEADLAGPIALSLAIYVVVKSVFAEDYNNTLGYIWVAIVAALIARYQVRSPELKDDATRRLPAGIPAAAFNAAKSSKMYR